MALRFGGMVVQKDGSEVVDERMLAFGRCLVVLQCCGKYLSDVEPFALAGKLAEVENLTNLLAGNIIEAAMGDGEQLLRDSLALAAHLDIELISVPMNRTAGGHDA